MILTDLELLRAYRHYDESRRNNRCYDVLVNEIFDNTDERWAYLEHTLALLEEEATKRKLF